MPSLAPPLSRRDFGRALGAATITAALSPKSEAASRIGADEAPSQASNTSNDEITLLSATELSAHIRRKQLSARDVMAAHLAQIERVNPKVNAIVTLVAERAMTDAARADEVQARSARVGVLHGLPVAHKDLVDTAGIRTTRGSPFHRDRVPTEDAPIVTRIRAAGAITHRQDQHAGVRRRLADLQHGLRRDAQSVRPRRPAAAAAAVPPWRSLRHGPDRRRQRHRRVAAQPGGVLQCRRHPSLTRTSAARGDVVVTTIGFGTDGAHGRRPRAVSQRDCRAGRQSAVDPGGRNTLPGGTGPQLQECARGLVARSRRHPLRARDPCDDRRQSARLRGARLPRRARRAGLQRSRRGISHAPLRRAITASMQPWCENVRNG